MGYICDPLVLGSITRGRSTTLSPLLVSMGWVEEKKRYSFKVAGWTFLNYLGNILPQSFHSDDGDTPVYKHQPRSVWTAFLKKFNLQTIPSKLTKEQKIWWRQFFLLPQFRSQNYEVNPDSIQRGRPLDLFIMHWLVHRERLILSDLFKSVFFYN